MKTIPGVYRPAHQAGVATKTATTDTSADDSLADGKPHASDLPIVQRCFLAIGRVLGYRQVEHNQEKLDHARYLSKTMSTQSLSSYLHEQEHENEPSGR